MAEYWKQMAERQTRELQDLRFKLWEEKRLRRAFQVVALFGGLAALAAGVWA